MRRVLAACAVAVMACATTALVPAEAAGTAPHVGIKSFTFFTGGVSKEVARGGTYRVCHDTKVKSVFAEGHVKGAKKGKKFRITWTHNGQKVSSFVSKWTVGGNFTEYYSFAPIKDGIAPGTWRLVISVGDNHLGGGKVVLGTKSC
jgi:hypothetical protein